MFHVCQKKVIVQTFIFTEKSLKIKDLFKVTFRKVLFLEVKCNEAKDHQNAIVLLGDRAQERTLNMGLITGGTITATLTLTIIIVYVCCRMLVTLLVSSLEKCPF